MDRTQSLGATDIAALTTTGKRWRTPRRIWEEKRGLKPEQAPSVRMRVGTALEELIANLYMEAMPGTMMQRADVETHTEYPFITCTPDFYGLTPIGKHIVEIKTASHKEGWGVPGSAVVPDIYYRQVQVQMGITGCTEAHIAVLFNSTEFDIYAVPFDPALYDEMIKASVAWWNTYVASEDPPPLADDDDPADYYPVDSGESIEATSDTVEAVQALINLRSSISVLEAQEKILENRIKAAMGEASYLTHPLLPGAVSWKAAKPSQVTDWQGAFAAAGGTPALLEKHQSWKPGSRRFLVPKEKGEEA
jgi:putative phage-type endonuclease